MKIELNSILIKNIELVKESVKYVVDDFDGNVSYTDNDINDIVSETMNYYPNLDWNKMDITYDKHSKDEDISTAYRTIEYFVWNESYKFRKLTKVKTKTTFEEGILKDGNF